MLYPTEREARLWERGGALTAMLEGDERVRVPGRLLRIRHGRGKSDTAFLAIWAASHIRDACRAEFVPKTFKVGRV